ncbi:MAG: DNA translocase FtsK, partial [Pseudomonadota bacterium]
MRHACEVDDDRRAFDGLADDIARSMSAKSARIAVVPGCNTLGIELPNAERETVAL